MDLPQMMQVTLWVSEFYNRRTTVSPSFYVHQVRERVRHHLGEEYKPNDIALLVPNSTGEDMDDFKTLHDLGYGLPGRRKKIVVVMRKVWLENRRREALVESSAEELD